MKTSLMKAHSLVNRLKKSSGMGNEIATNLVLDFSGFDDCTDEDSICIPLSLTLSEVITLKRKHSGIGINIAVPTSD
ncbi:MAG: hypothetical protein J6O03_07140 [Butyrivibrio sp.]|nr:hypothetical protein [Butyrivibrio sp.]